MKYTLLGIVFILTNCLGHPAHKKQNVRDSDDYGTAQERVSVLQSEIKAKSVFSDAEFELFNVNGFSDSRISLPGASSWDYKFVVKVDPKDVEKWIDTMLIKKDIEYNASWLADVISSQRKENWKIQSTPEIYIHEEARRTLIVYRTEGIIFKRVTQQ